jgi:5'-3' exonuclease
MRIALVDFGSVWGIAWHSFGDSELSEAHNSAVNRVLRLGEQYDCVAVCLDSPPYRRLQTDPQYKANRPPQSEQQIAQRKRTVETLRGHGFCLLAEPGEEADDVIASALVALATMATNPDGAEFRKKLEIDVISADKDLTQAHADEPVKVRVISPSNGEVLDPVEKWEIAPLKVRDALAMAGDTSDNIKGIEGVAAGRAAALIKAGLDVAGLRALVDKLTDANPHDAPEVLAPKLAEELPAKMGAKIALGILAAVKDGTLAMAYELVKLRTSIPINVDAIFAKRVPTPKDSEPEDGAWESEPPPANVAIQDSPPPCDAPGLPSPATLPGPGKALVHAPGWNRQLEPVSLGGAWKLSKALDDARLFTDFGTPSKVLAIVLSGREVGVGVMAALRGHVIIKGRVGMYAQFMMGLCVRHPTCEYFRPLGKRCNAQEAVVVAKRTTWEEGDEWSFTYEEAVQAGLVSRGADSMYKKWTKNMLIWRCVANAARVWFPDIVGGCYTPEELREAI